MTTPENEKVVEALIEVVEKIVLKDVMEKYWEMVYEKRESERTWHENAIFTDCFKVWATLDEGSKTHGRGGPISVVPVPLEFWDTVMAIYALKVPWYNCDHRCAAKYIVSNIERLVGKGRESIDGDFFKNFHNEHWKYITELATDNDGIIANNFLSRPFETVCVMRMQLVLASNPRPTQPELLEKWLEWIPKWEQEILDDTKEKFEQLKGFEHISNTVVTMNEFSKTMEIYTECKPATLSQSSAISQ